MSDEKAFERMCKIAIIGITLIVIVGIGAIVATCFTKGNADWYVPVKVVDSDMKLEVKNETTQ